MLDALDSINRIILKYNIASLHLLSTNLSMQLTPINLYESKLAMSNEFLNIELKGHTYCCEQAAGYGC